MRELELYSRFRVRCGLFVLECFRADFWRFPQGQAQLARDPEGAGAFRSMIPVDCHEFSRRIGHRLQERRQRRIQRGTNRAQQLGVGE